MEDIDDWDERKAPIEYIYVFSAKWGLRLAGCLKVVCRTNY